MTDPNDYNDNPVEEEAPAGADHHDTLEGEDDATQRDYNDIEYPDAPVDSYGY